MFVKKLLLAATAATAVNAIALRNGFACGSPEPTEEQIQIAQEFAVLEAEQAQNATLVARQSAISIDVYFHILATAQTVAGGWLSDATVQNQLNVINDNFAPHGIQFVLKGTDRTVNSAWARYTSQQAMKQSLRKGTYRSLNLYFLPDAGFPYLGECTFPATAGATSGSTTFIRDGCTILSTSVPGGAAAPYNEGKTATHEIGHWLGLYHTFEGGCTGAGDSVADTPAQASNSAGCPIGRDSCPTQPGLDPIHNYMDYSDDACYEEFTPGQDTRIRSFWNTYRAGK